MTTTTKMFQRVFTDLTLEYSYDFMQYTPSKSVGLYVSVSVSVTRFVM